MNPITEATTVEELAAIVVKALSSRKIKAVLTGGAVVSIYTDNQYKSYDLDFISSSDHKTIEFVMKTLGFEAKGKDFLHPKTKFTIEFPTGPLALGGRVPVEPEGRRIVNGVEILMLSPSQSVMDRLTGYYYYHDPQSLAQAVAICRDNEVDLEEVRKWSEEEKSLDKFQEFQDELEREGLG